MVVLFVMLFCSAKARSENRLSVFRQDDKENVVWKARERGVPAGTVVWTQSGLFWSAADIYVHDTVHRNFSRPGRLPVSGRMMESEIDGHLAAGLTDVGRRAHVARARSAGELVFHQRYGIYVYDRELRQESAVVSYGHDVLLGPMLVDPFGSLFFARRRAADRRWEVNRWNLAHTYSSDDDDIFLIDTGTREINDMTYQPNGHRLLLVLDARVVVQFSIADPLATNRTIMKVSDTHTRIESILAVDDGSLYVAVSSTEQTGGCIFQHSLSSKAKLPVRLIDFNGVCHHRRQDQSSLVVARTEHVPVSFAFNSRASELYVLSRSRRPFSREKSEL